MNTVGRTFTVRLADHDVGRTFTVRLGDRRSPYYLRTLRC